MSPKMFVGVLLFFSSCGQEGNAHARQEPDPRGAPSASTRWETVRAPTDRSLLEAPARVVAGPTSEARIAAPFSARVMSIAVAPGQTVRVGDVLLEVTMPEVLDAAAVWIASREQISLRRGRQSQLQTLRDQGLVEENRVFEQATSLADLNVERARALAVLQAAGIGPARAQAALRAGRTSLESPIAGVVREIDAHLGEVRDVTGPPLVVVIGLAPARIEARLTRPLPEGAELFFVPLGLPPIALRARVDATAIDPNDGTRITWIAPNEPIELPDGLRGTLQIHVTRAGVVEISANAITHDREGPFVVRRTDTGNERVRISVLASGGASALVEALGEWQLSIGDSIATDVSVLLRGPEVDE